MGTHWDGHNRDPGGGGRGCGRQPFPRRPLWLMRGTPFRAFWIRLLFAHKPFGLFCTKRVGWPSFCSERIFLDLRAVLLFGPDDVLWMSKLGEVFFQNSPGSTRGPCRPGATGTRGRAAEAPQWPHPGGPAAKGHPSSGRGPVLFPRSADSPTPRGVGVWVDGSLETPPSSPGWGVRLGTF